MALAVAKEFALQALDDFYYRSGQSFRLKPKTRADPCGNGGFKPSEPIYEIHQLPLKVAATLVVKPDCESLKQVVEVLSLRQGHR